jgi:hypothetical protein
MVDAQSVQDGRVQIVDMDWFHRSVAGKVVVFSDADHGLDAAPGHPNSKAARVMVPRAMVELDKAHAAFGQGRAMTQFAVKVPGLPEKYGHHKVPRSAREQLGISITGSPASLARVYTPRPTARKPSKLGSV